MLWSGGRLQLKVRRGKVRKGTVRNRPISPVWLWRFTYVPLPTLYLTCLAILALSVVHQLGAGSVVVLFSLLLMVSKLAKVLSLIGVTMQSCVSTWNN